MYVCVSIKDRLGASRCGLCKQIYTLLVNLPTPNASKNHWNLCWVHLTQFNIRSVIKQLHRRCVYCLLHLHTLTPEVYHLTVDITFVYTFFALFDADNLWLLHQASEHLKRTGTRLSISFLFSKKVSCTATRIKCIFTISLVIIHKLNGRMCGAIFL